MNGVVREYEYRAPLALIVFGLLFFGFGSVVPLAQALSNDRGLVINHIIELGPAGATAFYWVLFAVAIGFVVMAGIAACQRLLYRQRLALSPTALIVPVSRWSSKEMEIAYQDIQGLSSTQIYGEQFLYVHHTRGKFTVVASMLASRTTFEEVHELLAAKVREVSAENSGARRPAPWRRRIP